MKPTDRLERDLNDFDPDLRLAALAELARRAREGELDLPAPGREVNLHLHTFFSFNGEGWSPSRIAWEARKRGLGAIGSIDFDVLDAMDEIFAAGDLLGLKTAAGLETRVFIREFAEEEMNSPGEPGVAYFTGNGFVRLPQSESARATLAAMAAGAAARNRDLLGRVNDFLERVRIDYDRDVLPLAPSGNATERHLLAAYKAKSRETFGPDREGEVAFWAEKLALDPARCAQLLGESNAFRDTLRSKLMKKGGVGYVQPDETTFPPVEDVIGMILDAGAIPSITWLDGTRPGEADARRLVETLEAKGCRALALVPDRNWNIADPDEKALKIGKLEEIVDLCREKALPVLAGTEMNKAGQRFVDDFAAPELANVTEDFLQGADFLAGHTLLARARGVGALSPWAHEHFAGRAERVAFYASLGRAARSPAEALERFASLAETFTPGEALAALGA